ncbi:vWA domain-containing protein [Rhizobium sp. CC-YZS058]|uniref:vWA domain-containing protein n=1 Tax=Rhizobium sp. CC-YZS058 TaxID=3042153 RepID=UPI002B0526EB|nr:VWA domain-containing protein [Rhizobium sp. CC-YZS058]MEA3537414.1 VWA domain-containing protein [Rhizobium sp. CC-YZS058]
MMTAWSRVEKAMRGVGSVSRRLLLVLAMLLAHPPATGFAAERTLLPAAHGPVVLVLDASGSMAAALGKETRLDAARRVLLDTIALFPDDRPVALVAYGHRRKRDCGDIETLARLGPVDRAAIRRSLSALQAKGKTPLSGALSHAAGLLPPSGGTIMLVSDGLETCAADPCAVAEALKAAHAGLVIHVVGFGLAEGEMKRLACIADKGGGRAIETLSATGLAKALQTLAGPQTAGPDEDGPAPASERKPTEPPPPTPKPVTLSAVIGDRAVPAAVAFTVTDQSGATVYSGKGKDVSPSLVPGRYTVRLAASNLATQTTVTVTGEPDERHSLPLGAGLVRFSVVAAEGVAIGETDLKGDPVWTLAARDGQAQASLEGVLAPETMLAPGRYDVMLSLGGVQSTAEIAVRAGETLQTTLNLRLGKVTLEAGLPGAKAPIESGTGLSWTLSSGKAADDRKAEAVARPTFLVPSGRYTATLSLSGAVIEATAEVEEGKTALVHLDLPSATLTLEGSLGPGAPAFTDWRDASWTVRPVRLIGDIQAGPALEDQLEATPSLVLTPGEWAVTLVSGAARVTRTITLAPGAKGRERLDLDASRLSISAQPAPGSAPPANVLLSIFPAKADGGFAETPIVQVGTPRDYATILPAGRYRVDAADEQGRKGSKTIDLTEGQSPEIGVTLK